nr:glycerate kinase [Streptococcus suis]
MKTQGVGELIVELVQNGVKRIFIGVGGSASHDGGYRNGGRFRSEIFI